MDVLDPDSGAMDVNLSLAIARALKLDRGQCLLRGRSFSWERSTDQVLAALVYQCGPVRRPERVA